MNKTNLQKELKEKVKPGIKPSDLKKKGKNTIPDEGYESDNSLSRNNKNQSEQQKNNLSLKKDKQIQDQIKFESQKAQNYLEQITKLTAEIDSANLEIKELKKIKPTRTQTELEKALREANSKIRDQEKSLIHLNTYLEKIEILESENKHLIEKYAKLENQTKNKDNPELFTCSQCQQEWSKEFIRLVDQNGNKTCVECVEKMLNLASKERGKEIILETEEKEPKKPKTYICHFCRQEKPTNQIKDRHIKNLPDGTDPREIVKICQDCLTYRAIKADYYCPRTSEGRDTYEGSEFDCYCPQTKYF